MPEQALGKSGRRSQLTLCVKATQGGVGQHSVDAPGRKLSRDRQWAQGRRAPADVPFGEGLVVEVAELDQAFDRRVDFLFPVAPAAQLAPDLRSRVRSAGEQPQASVKGSNRWSPAAPPRSLLPHRLVLVAERLS